MQYYINLANGRFRGGVRGRWVGKGERDCRPAQSSDKAEDLPLLASFFLNLPPSRFILKFLCFFKTLLVVANNVHRHIEVLLFSTSFIISVLFGDVKTEKLGSFCVTGR